MSDNRYNIHVSKVPGTRGLYRLHTSRSGQNDRMVESPSIGAARALLERAIAIHDSNRYVVGLKNDGFLAADDYDRAMLQHCISSALAEVRNT